MGERQLHAEERIEGQPTAAVAFPDRAAGAPDRGLGPGCGNGGFGITLG